MHASEFARKRAKIERRAGNRAAFLRKAMAHLVHESRATVVTVRGQVVAWRMVDGGVVCVKRRYRNELAAADDLNSIRLAASERAHVPVRSYWCAHCGGFHLTSQQPNNRAG